MLRYALKNILLMIPVLFCVVTIVFIIGQFTPGDPVLNFMPTDYTQEQYDYYAEKLGTNKPVLEQYYNYIVGIVTRFEFGYSYQTGRQVLLEISERFPVTLKLGLLSCLLTMVVGIPLGVLSATKQYSIFDYSTTITAIFFAAVPGFWLSMMMILLFSLNLGWLPASGLDSWKSYIMPVIGSSLGAIANITRQTRSSMLEVVRQDYIQTARAKGLSEGTVIRKHALKNALIPVVTILGMNLGAVMGGSPIMEVIHNIPGVGTLMLTAINTKDAPMIQTIVLFLSSIVCIMNVVVDIAYGFIDPRIKAGFKKNKKQKA